MGVCCSNIPEGNVGREGEREKEYERERGRDDVMNREEEYTGRGMNFERKGGRKSEMERETAGD